MKIAVVGKYTNLVDAYKSVQQALVHGGIANDVEVDVDWVSSEHYEEGTLEHHFDGFDGLLIPGGFGDRGVEGMLVAIQWARENGLPFFGICLGLQCAIIEFARTVCGRTEANSVEFDSDTADPVICLMDSQQQVTAKGGTMRLGEYAASLREGSCVEDVYGEAEIKERHRHRYEVNNEFRDLLEGQGLIMSGTSPDDGLVEMIELPDHPWFIACQFHPELKSRPTRPHPLFASFIKAATAHAERSRAEAAVGVGE